MNRIRPSTIVDKVKEISLAKYPVYDHDHILKAYRAHVQYFKRHNKKELPEVWSSFAKLTAWFFMSGHPFLKDNKGDLFMPFDTDKPNDWCPVNPKTLICNWQRKVFKLQPRVGGRSRKYLFVEEYTTGEILKLYYYDGFNLEYFKDKLLNEYFIQFFSLELNSDLSSLKSVRDIYKDVVDSQRGY